jgi:hypothetical protein
MPTALTVTKTIEDVRQSLVKGMLGTESEEEGADGGGGCLNLR